MTNATQETLQLLHRLMAAFAVISLVVGLALWDGVSMLFYTYLKDKIEQHKPELSRGAEGALEMFGAVSALKARLEKILEGTKLYDAFARWKKFCNRSIECEFGLNDCVQPSLRSFCMDGILYDNAESLNIKVRIERNDNHHFSH